MTDKSRLAKLKSALIPYNEGQAMGVIPVMLAEYREKWRPYIEQRGEFNKLFQKMENSNANYPLGYMTNYYFRNFEHPTTPFYDGLYSFDTQNYRLLTEQEMAGLEEKFKVDEMTMEVKQDVQEIRDYVDGVVAKNAPIRRLKGMGEFYSELVAIRDEPWYYPEDVASQMKPKGEYICPDVHAGMGLTMPFHRKLYVKLEPMYETFDTLETKLKRLKTVLDSVSSDLAFSEFREGTTEELVSSHPSRAFIAHGGESAALNKVRSFLKALGVEPLVVEIQPSEGRLTEPQVDEYMKQADCAIILATYGHIVDMKTRKKHPRLNVVDELGRCRKAFPHRTILLLEKGVDLPSNVSGIVYEQFTKQNMENAFIKVAKELRAFGLIRPMKPSG